MAQRDERVAGKLGQRDRAASSQPVPGGHGQADLLLAQQLGALRHAVQRHRRVEQQIAALGRAGNAQVGRAVRGGKAREDVAQPPGARQRADAQAARMVQALLDLMPRILLGAQDVARIPQQDIALRRAAQALARALEQGGAQFAFQVADGFGHRRLRHMQAARGTRHVFQLGDGSELPELIEFQRVSSVSCILILQDGFIVYDHTNSV